MRGEREDEGSRRDGHRGRLKESNGNGGRKKKRDTDIVGGRRRDRSGEQEEGIEGKGERNRGRRR